jgi:tRNA pseudouridine55 synthase
VQSTINGIIIVDKPKGLTSAQVVARLKKIFRAKKAGHTGTLDPFATGVMVCCINRATRLSKFFLHSNKKYKGVICLGVETDSFDATGKVTATCDVDFNDNKRFSAKKIHSVFEQFKGPIDQLPPVFSALKHKGVPLYKLARQGTPVQKPPRPVNIFGIKILKIDLPYIIFEVSCSAGTYIRSLCADIGKALGCGGHLKELQRIECCGFSIDEAFTLKELEQRALSEQLTDIIINMPDALPDMQKVVATDLLKGKIQNGIKVTPKDGLPVSGFKSGSNRKQFFKIVDIKNDLIAILEFDEQEDAFNYCCVFNN